MATLDNAILSGDSVSYTDIVREVSGEADTSSSLDMELNSYLTSDAYKSRIDEYILSARKVLEELQVSLSGSEQEVKSYHEELTRVFNELTDEFVFLFRDAIEHATKLLDTRIDTYIQEHPDEVNSFVTSHIDTLNQDSATIRKATITKMDKDSVEVAEGPEELLMFDAETEQKITDTVKTLSESMTEVAAAILEGFSLKDIAIEEAEESGASWAESVAMGVIGGFLNNAVIEPMNDILKEIVQKGYYSAAAISYITSKEGATAILTNLTDDLSSTISDSITSAYESLKESINIQIDKLLTKLGLGSSRVSHDRPDMIPKTKLGVPIAVVPEINPKSTKYVSAKRSQYKTSNQSLAMSHLWDIQITPHKSGNSFTTPPDINEYFGIDSESYRLPIINYSLQGKSVQNLKISMYSNLSVTIPNSYTTFDALVMTFVSMVYSENNTTSDAISCLDAFKEDYINYTSYMTDPSLDSSLRFKDFRSCSYELVIRRFTPYLQILDTWKLLGVPDVRMNLQGTNTATMNTDTLGFHIVGEYF